MRTPYKLDDFRFSLVIRKNKISKDELIYGDTPVLTLCYLLKAAGFFGFKQDKINLKFFDLGAGRGWGILAAKFFGADSSRGCDINPEHVALSENILKKIGCDLIFGNANAVDLNNQNFIYLAWTTWSKLSRDKICENLKNLKTNSKIITLTWGLDLKKFSDFKEIKRGASVFSWGLANFYIYEKQ